MLAILQYSFIERGLIAGLIIAIIAPLIGIFLVLRRYSLIADTLSHVSFAGVALGFLLGINPVITAILASVLSSVIIEKLRKTQRVYGESALSLFLSGSLAVAIVLISLHHGFNANLSNYLFGSILTVQNSDLYLIAGAGLLVALSILLFFKELMFISFDEEAAQVSGIPVSVINTLFIIFAAVTVALAIPVVGVLLIAALIVVPVLTAIQFRKSFRITILIAEAVSVISVFGGMFFSYYLDLSSGGTIVLFALLLFVLSLFWNQKAK